MDIKIHFLVKLNFRFLLIAVFFLLSLTGINAQCAGDDASLTVCDIPNTSSSSINLFNLLGGSPIAGGTWNDDDLSDGLNIATGILNAQAVRRSGIYKFTYTVDSSSGCVDNTATVTVTIGGYAGVSGANNSTCSDEGTYNLFELFNGTFLSPQSNGIWSDDDSSGFSSGSILNVDLALGTLDQRTLRFTYRVPAIGTCPESVAAQASVTIFRAAKPGIPSNLTLCSTQTSAYTNVDLNDLLADEDAGGRWTDANTPSTMELTSATDHYINVQNLGIGTFFFVYTVRPKSPVCRERTATVRIVVEELLDFTGATLVINSDICENEIGTALYTAILTQGAQNIPNGQYDVSYQISGPNGTVINTVRTFFNNGILNFPIDRVLFNTVGSYTVRITSIINTNSFGACTNIINNLSDVLNVYPLPVLNSPLNIDPICQGQDAIVSFSAATSLPNGNYSITYNLTGSNVINGQTVIVTATGGVLSGFSIPANLIPNSGSTTITMTNIRNLITNCSNSVAIAPYQFIINPVPVTNNLSIVVNNTCQDEPVQVLLSGLNSLSNITVSYNLSGANTANNQTAALVVSSGNGSFIIPSSLITNIGPTTISITFIRNTITTCGSTANSTASFTISPLPTAPVANNASFCEADNAIVGNLLPNAIQYQWFNSPTATSPLPNNTILVTGNYYVREINASTGCISPATTITVTINRVDRPALLININPVCQGQDATVSFSTATSLPNGDYSITYNLTGNNIVNGQTATVTATGGLLSGFSIPAGLIPNSGNTIILITTIRDLITNCSNSVIIAPYQFLINPVPVTNNLSIVVNNTCQDEPVQVLLSGLNNLSNITISYNLSGANTANNQTAALVVSSGNGSFIIPSSLITNTGSTTISITFIRNTVTTCGSAVNSTLSFTISPLPTAPVANNSSFCEANNATVGNLLPNGMQYQWFNTPTATSPLSNSTSLVTGNYYVKQINTLTGCSSPATMITVTINSVDSPTLNPLGQNFCGAENPTIQNLTNNTSSNNAVIWFDSATGGNQLPATTLLRDGVTYYGFGFSNIVNCFSVNGLPVTVSLTNCDVVPSFFIPDGFSPNGDGVNDTFAIPDIEFIYPDYSLEIYNRYGNLIFKGNKNKPNWDGNNSQSNVIDAMAPNGVYFYVLHYNKGNISPKQGRLYLNR